MSRWDEVARRVDALEKRVCDAATAAEMIRAITGADKRGETEAAAKLRTAYTAATGRPAFSAPRWAMATRKDARDAPGMYSVTIDGVRLEIERDDYGLWVMYAFPPGAGAREYTQDFRTLAAAKAAGPATARHYKARG